MPDGFHRVDDRKPVPSLGAHFGEACLRATGVASSRATVAAYEDPDAPGCAQVSTGTVASTPLLSITYPGFHRREATHRKKPQPQPVKTKPSRDAGLGNPKAGRSLP
jgi:hypothetical protein